LELRLRHPGLGRDDRDVFDDIDHARGFTHHCEDHLPLFGRRGTTGQVNDPFSGVDVDPETFELPFFLGITQRRNDRTGHMGVTDLRRDDLARGDPAKADLARDCLARD